MPWLCRSPSLAATLALAAAALLAAPAAAARPLPATSAPPAAASEDEAGALIGDLVFHADLLAALDRLCPARAGTDWHAALRRLLDAAFTPELRALSRRLGADAGARMLAERGGCQSAGFAAAYAESRDEYRALLKRWQAIED